MLRYKTTSEARDKIHEMNHGSFAAMISERSSDKILHCRKCGLLSTTSFFVGLLQILLYVF
jgi:hypothetical protein